ncbi:MAG: PepSY-like domain-containing protein [Saprospirales bacterium]|nr:PepSY-like domain-containing protein [Saprospirales bacterium]
MKFWFLLIIFGLGSIPRIFAQWDGEDSLCAVPVGVKKAFQDQYPKAEEVYWVKGKNDYRASFFVEGLSHEIRYSSSGQWICASTYLDLADLPKSIQDFLTHRFPEWEIPSVLQKIERPDHSFIYLVNFDMPEGMLELTFNNKGTITSEKMDTYHDDED